MAKLSSIKFKIPLYREIKRCLRSLLIHRLRSLLSTLGVLFGVVAVVAMLSIGEGAKQETLEQIEQLGMNSIIVRQHAMSDEQRVQALEQKSRGLTWQDVEALRKNIPILTDNAPLRVIEATLTGALTQASPEILAVNRAFADMKQLQLAEGRFLCDLDQEGKRLVCVLGYEVAKDLGKEGHIGHTLKLGNIHYEIVGILKSTYWKASKNQSITTRNLDQAVFIPLGSDIGLISAPLAKDGLSEIILQIQDTQHMESAVKLIKKILRRLHGGYEDYQIVIPQELLQQAYRTQQIFNLVLGSIAAISLLVGGIGIMNVMLATISERTREIGIRRAVGASQRHILLQFLFETFLLTLIGAVLGILLGLGCSMAISTLAGWKTIVTPWSIILSLMMSSVVGLCSGLYPAYQAAMMDPIKALRHD
jgi:putative ABC transport system permease protein